MLCMNYSISFGRRKISVANYSRFVVIPKQLLENLGVDSDDYLEFVIKNGNCIIKPHKAAPDVRNEESGEKGD